MGRAYDYAFRPNVGEPAEEDGGPCDDRPRAIELYAAGADPLSSSASWQAFSLCPEHESQLRRYDERLHQQGLGPRFRSATEQTTTRERGR
jgi:hypothetical protein